MKPKKKKGRRCKLVIVRIWRRCFHVTGFVSCSSATLKHTSAPVQLFRAPQITAYPWVMNARRAHTKQGVREKSTRAQSSFPRGKSSVRLSDVPPKAASCQSLSLHITHAFWRSHCLSFAGFPPQSLPHARHTTRRAISPSVMWKQTPLVAPSFVSVLRPLRTNLTAKQSQGTDEWRDLWGYRARRRLIRT